MEKVKEVAKIGLLTVASLCLCMCTYVAYTFSVTLRNVDRSIHQMDVAVVVTTKQVNDILLHVRLASDSWKNETTKQAASLDSLHRQLTTTLQRVDGVVASVDRLVNDTNDNVRTVLKTTNQKVGETGDAVQQLAHDGSRTLDETRTTFQLTNRLLADPSLQQTSSNIQMTTANVARTTDEMAKTMVNVTATTDELRSYTRRITAPASLAVRTLKTVASLSLSFLGGLLR